MWVVWVASVLIWMIFTGMSSLFEGYTRGADAEPHWCELEGAWSCPSWPVAASYSATSTWSFSNVETLMERSPWTLMTPLGDDIFKTRYP
jgi:hypothetical protein